MKWFFTPTYIEQYKNVLTQDQCKSIISYFESRPKIDGAIGEGTYDKSKKSCLELPRLSFSNIEYKFISDIIYPNLYECVQKYRKKYKELDSLYFWKISDIYNIQKYSLKDDGYKVWHCEHGPSKESSIRIMAWMFYLNSAKSGTKFLRYPRIKPRSGDCIIWPASWTHTHRGEIPNKNEKYIVTGWIEYAKM